MTSALTNWFGNKILVNNLLKNGAWLALHSGDPGVTGSTADEFVGGGYERQYILFDNPSGKTIVSATKAIFPALPTGTLSYFSLNSGHTLGNMYCSFEISPHESIAADSILVVRAGEIAVVL